jgi:hypothetical protein
MDWRCGSSGRPFALQVESPEFKTSVSSPKKVPTKKIKE